MGAVLTMPPIPRRRPRKTVAAARSAARFLTVAAAAWMAAAQSRAADATLEAAVWSKYLFRGQVFTDGPVFQPSLTLAAPGGLSFNTWVNVDLDNANASAGHDTRLHATEVDVTAAWTPAAVPDWLKPRLGATAYVVSEPREAAGTTAEVWAEMRFDPAAGDRRPWPALLAGVYYETLEYEGAYACAGLEREMALTEPLSLTLAATIGYGGRRYNRFFFADAGPDPTNAPEVDRGCWNDATLRAELSWRIRANVRVAAVGLYQVLVEDPVRAAARARYGDSEWWVGGVRAVWEF